MRKTIIGYENITSEYSTLVATTEALGYDVINLTTWLPYEWYGVAATGTQYVTFTFATSRTIDYLGVFSHNLSETSSSLAFEYWSGSAWVEIVAGLATSNSQVIMRAFDSVTSDQFRIKLTAGTTDLKIGIVSFGRYMEMQTGADGGFALPHLESKDKAVNGMSETGLLLGRSIIAKYGTASFNFSVVTQEWVRNNWIAFIDHAKTKPFFISWNNDVYPDDAIFGITSKDIASPKFNEGEIMSISLSCDAWHTLRV